MIRMLIHMLFGIVANAIGLLAANLILDNFDIDTMSFIFAVLLFSLVTAVLGPLVVKIALTNAPFLMGGIALVTTFVGLLVTNFFSDGISINGLGTWIAATVIVWIFSVGANVILPLFLFKKTLDKRSADKKN